MHDGVYGRSHLYSYVNDNGTWWKTVDWVVTEASDKYPPFRIENDLNVVFFTFLFSLNRFRKRLF
jgi:hypothetical protein